MSSIELSFVGRGRIRAAIQLSAGLPESIITTGASSPGQEVEYLLYSKLFALWEQFSIVEQMVNPDPQTRSITEQDGQGHWKRRLEVRISDFTKIIVQRFPCRIPLSSCSTAPSVLWALVGVWTVSDELRMTGT
jgi:hypothetical protein